MHDLMKPLSAPALLLLFAAGVGCSSRTDCEIAQDTLDRCNAENAASSNSASHNALPLSITGECSGVNACVAPCVNKTSCAGITWVERTGGVDEADPDAPPVPKDGGALFLCIQECLKRPQQP
ncbi:MAG: hypothetical protein ABI548_22660 [Polyangiaceae bacterium]